MCGPIRVKERILIKVYEKTKSFCQQCMATKRWLDARGHDYELLSVEEHPEVVDAAKELGVTAAPIVIVSDGHLRDEAIWGGFDTDQLEAVIGGDKQ